MRSHQSEQPEIEMAIRLRQVCEAHDPTITCHLDNVARYSCELARLIGLPEEKVRQIYHAAPLHDIGKIGLRRALLEKPGALDANEMMTIHSHTKIGYDLLAGSPWPTIQCAATIARSHHENWDGSGYPEALSGKAIPLESRVIAVCEVFDTLTSGTSDKAAAPFDSAVREIESGAGTQFDPDAVSAFLQAVRSGEISPSEKS